MDLHEVARRSFQTIRGRLAGALVYLDTGAGETAAHSLGARFFFDLGASNVCELKTACSQDAALPLLIGQAYPVVIFITQLLTTAQEQILKAVKAHPSATGVTVFCSYSVDAHPNLSGAVIGSNAYADFEQMLQKEADWRNQGLDDKDEAREAMIDARQQELYQRSGQEASVRYFPFQLCAVTGRTFVLPSTCAAVQTRSGGIPAGFGDYDEKSNQAGDAINLGDTANAVSLIGHTLSGVASQLGVKFDTYTLGPFSQRIGQEIARLGVRPAVDGTVPQEEASLVLIDRRMDLIAPTRHTDNLMDRMVAALRRAEGPNQRDPSSKHKPTGLRSTDMRIPLQPLYPSNGIIDPSVPLGGSLELSDSQSQAYFGHLLPRRSREGALLVRKWLREAHRKESIDTPVRSRAGPVQQAELQALAQNLAQQAECGMKHHLAVSYGFAAAQTLSPEHAQKWDMMSSNENQIMLASTPEEIVAMFVDLIRNTTKDQAVLNLDDVMQLLVLAYSLGLEGMGELPLFSGEEQQIMDAITDALVNGSAPIPSWMADLCASIREVRDKKSGDPEAYGYESAALKLELRDFLADRFDRLKAVGAARTNLREFRQLSDPMSESGATSGSFASLAHRMLSKIIDQEALSDLTHTPSLLKGLLNVGLGRLGFQSSQKPSDHQTVILFVVGGLSILEIRDMLNEIDRRGEPGMTYILGGSVVLTPQDVVEGVFA